MQSQEQPPIVENPFWVRMDRRIKTYLAAFSKRRGKATLRFIDFKKMPLNPEQSRRYAIYGDLLACFLILQEWNPDVKHFGMAEGRHPVSEDDPAVDASAVVISHLASGEVVWTTCVNGMPKSTRGKERLTADKRNAEAAGATHQIFTYEDGRSNATLLENFVFLNPMLHRVPSERYDCRFELNEIISTLKRNETTTLGFLQTGKSASSIARMQGTVARLIHSGDLETVQGLGQKRFSLISELRWSMRPPTFDR
jgi:hypothetical protein